MTACLRNLPGVEAVSGRSQGLALNQAQFFEMLHGRERNAPRPADARIELCGKPFARRFPQQVALHHGEE